MVNCNSIGKVTSVLYATLNFQVMCGDPRIQFDVVREFMQISHLMTSVYKRYKSWEFVCEAEIVVSVLG